MSGANRLRLNLLAAATLAALAGCQTGPRPVPNDPLIGAAQTGRPANGASRASDPPVRVPGELPPVPPTSSTTSPAALTLGAVTAGDRRSPVEGVTLHGPRTKDGRPGAVAEPESKPAPAAGGYESLQQQLRARGVVWQQLRMVEREEWHFICAIPDPKQPNVRRNYEARATGAGGLTAMRMVLEEIDRERR